MDDQYKTILNRITASIALALSFLWIILVYRIDIADDPFGGIATIIVMLIGYSISLFFIVSSYYMFKEERWTFFVWPSIVFSVAAIAMLTGLIKFKNPFL